MRISAVFSFRARCSPEMQRFRVEIPAADEKTSRKLPIRAPAADAGTMVAARGLKVHIKQSSCRSAAALTATESDGKFGSLK